MGYRSEVVFLCKKKDLDKIDKILSEHGSSLKDSDLYNISDEYDLPVEYIALGNDYIKWYDGYGNVDAFNKMISKLEELRIPFEFLRIGENYEDVEWRNEWELDFDIHIYLTRDVSIG